MIDDPRAKTEHAEMAGWHTGQHIEAGLPAASTRRVVRATFVVIVALAAAAAASMAAQPDAAATYTESYRPQFHFTPATGWMGDPSGLVYENGRYHLFYWGHAVSRDLVHWQHWPRALTKSDGVGVMSGSAVVDWNDTSGFGPAGRAPMVAIYSGLHEVDRRQTQDLAYSTDSGRTWTKYAGNPVIDIGSSEFRDPQVFWHESSRRWIMVVALAADHKVRFYGSPDLKAWAPLSDFGPAGATGGVWECPDLFPLSVDGNAKHIKWVLKVDVQPAGGQYFVGDFDGSAFHVDRAWLDLRLRAAAADQREPAPWTDQGNDFYAARSWHGMPATNPRRIWIGWMSNWRYAQKVPTAPWQGQQSIPRELMLRTDASGQLYLEQRPIRELERLRRHHWHRTLKAASGEQPFAAAGIRGTTLEISADFDRGDAAEFGLKVRQGMHEETVVGYDTTAGAIFVDRTRSGRADFNPAFAARHAAALQPDRGHVRLHLFVDASSIEVFGNDGRVVISDQIFPEPSSDRVTLYARGGSLRGVALDAWELGSIW